MEDLKELIEILRMGYGSHSKAAHKLGIHINHYSLIRNGRGKPSTLLYNSMVIHAKVIKEDIKKLIEK